MCVCAHECVHVRACGAVRVCVCMCACVCVCMLLQSRAAFPDADHLLHKKLFILLLH